MSHEVRLHAELYDQAAVDAAARAYAEHANIAITRHEHEIVASFATASQGEELDELVDAFCNHALFETISGRQSRWRSTEP